MGDLAVDLEFGDELQAATWAVARSAIGTLRETLRGHDLTPPQYWILQMLVADRALSPGEIAQRLCVRPPTASGLVDNLVEDGYARRKAFAEDRRVVRIESTAKGRSVIRAVRSDLVDRWAARLAPMPAGQRQRAAAALRELSRYLAGESGPAPTRAGRSARSRRSSGAIA